MGSIQGQGDGMCKGEGARKEEAKRSLGKLDRESEGTGIAGSCNILAAMGLKHWKGFKLSAGREGM